MSNLYFKPTKSELSREQVVKQLGVDPDQMDEEILLSYALYPIEDSMGSKGALDNPHPVYIDKGTYFLKCPSTEDIDLTEGKLIAKKVLTEKVNSDLEKLANEIGINAFTALALSLLPETEMSPSLSSFKSRQSKTASDLNQSLMEVEAATSIDDLRKILNPNP